MKNHLLGVSRRILRFRGELRVIGRWRSCCTSGSSSFFFGGGGGSGQFLGGDSPLKGPPGKPAYH